MKWLRIGFGENVDKLQVLIPEFLRYSTKLENFYERFYHIIS